jgi:hypothetical protein
MAMSHWIDQLGVVNPQFLRECRGRLKPRNVMAAVGLSLIFQFLLYIGNAEIGAPIEVLQQQSICTALTLTIPYALFVIGGFYLVDDLAREEKTGTLNFIRLSPRPAFEILLGKLLGVPLLPVILVGSAIPLHVVSALLGGMPALWLVSYYLLVGFGTAFVFSLALLFGLVGSSSTFGRQQALSSIGFAGLALIVIAPLFMTWNFQINWWSWAESSPMFSAMRVSQTPPEWLYLPIARNVAIAHLFTLANLVIASLFVWKMLLRQFCAPQSTLLSKRLSYVGVAYLNGLTWGFFQSNSLSAEASKGGVVVLALLNFSIFTSLIVALAPARQTLLDWLRYRQRNLTDWIWNDSSPSVVAIAINFAIASGLIVPWILTFNWGGTLQPTTLLLAVLSMGTSVLIYATLVQIIFSSKLRSPLLWAVGVVVTIAAVPPTILGLLTDQQAMRSPFMIAVWTLFGLPFWRADELGAASAGILIGWLVQLLIFLLLLLQLARSLQQLSAHRSADF